MSDFGCTELSPAFAREFLICAALGLSSGFVFECWNMFAVKKEESFERGLFLEVEALQRFKEVQKPSRIPGLVARLICVPSPSAHGPATHIASIS